MRNLIRPLRLALILGAVVIALSIVSVHGRAQQGAVDLDKVAGANRARAVRDALAVRVGGIDKLRVPSSDAALPQPLLTDGAPDPRYQITEAKRYLGKLLFFDPVRSNRIHPEFGGLPSTARTGSCGSCHLGEVAGKAGQVINLHLGGEGRGFTDSAGVFHVRRRIQPGLQDVIPTGQQEIINGIVVKDGRFDAVDSVPRLSPSMIGFGFNTRLLLNGKAGEPESVDNPHHLPAAENLCEIAFNVHRMLETQQSAIQESPVYVKLFHDAFPDEAAIYEQTLDINDLINDATIERAVATFLRTVVTRNTPFDRFLAGDDSALTKRQLNGLKLFLNDTAHGGANCIQCHSGPMLNKQLGDEAGVLVNENFFNVGVGDHPLQQLGAIALEDPNHHDIGRGEITLQSEDNYKFRTLTLRQLRDSGGQMMHSALFTSTREVVNYFNAGIPQDALAVAAGNVTPLFTHPRGPGSEPGLGLTPRQIDALVDFLDNGLYDPAFARFDPNSSTDSFELNERDLIYSANRPELVAYGAVDGLMPSGLCPSSDDGLTRRDRGLEFLDVSRQIFVSVRGVERDAAHNMETHHLSLTNIGSSPIDTHLLMCFMNLSPGASVVGAEGFSEHLPSPGVPYMREFVPHGEVDPGETMNVDVIFRTNSAEQVGFTLDFLSGQGKP
ncbi:MAG TPA: cytochrome c peroxidase [Blastocatellia bacterium]|nr:cytochrome c peroxidase [Blastocatellia bacterium]